MHYFLTGPVQVGKSTIIRRLLRELGCTTGGFCTVAAPVQADGSSAIHLVPGYDGAQTPENRVLIRLGGDERGKFLATPAVFDRFGPGYLSRPGQLILMDELGRAEKDCLRFQQAVLQCLDRETPVLGVLQPFDTPFLDKIRQHDRVQVIPVTVENREAVFADLLRHYRAMGLAGSKA